MRLSDRQIQLIQAIVDTYIQTAEPVSSKYLGEEIFSDISSATIRNEMSELEDQGFLVQLHTSGGRIPTDQAYRLFVDYLLSEEDLDPPRPVRMHVREALHSASPDPRSINRVVAQLVSELSDNLVIANTLQGHDFFKVGLSSLFEFPEFREFDRMFRITEVFEQFDQLFSQIEADFFEEFFHSQEAALKVVIGYENPLRKIQDESVILAKYQLPDKQTGSLTVIGPTRMNYRKNVGLVRCVVEEINKHPYYDKKTHI